MPVFIERQQNHPSSISGDKKKKEGNDAADIPDITNMVPTEANVIASIGAELLHDTQDTTKEDRKIENHGIGSDATVLCAIAAQIAVENVSAAPQALMVIARIARCLDKDDERKRICRMVAEKIRKINNSNYLQIWAQQLTIEDDRENDPVPYDEPLCSIAIGQKKKIYYCPLNTTYPCPTSLLPVVGHTNLL